MFLLLCIVPEPSEFLLTFFFFFYFCISVFHIRSFPQHLPILTYWFKSEALESGRKFCAWYWHLFPGEPHCGVIGRGGHFVEWPSNICTSVLLSQPVSLERSPPLSYLERISLVTSVLGGELSLGLGRRLTIECMDFPWILLLPTSGRPLFHLPKPGVLESITSLRTLEN